MKKLIITSIFASAAVFASADTLTFKGGPSTERTLTGATATTDVILDSTDGMYYRGAVGADQTVHTIKAISNASGSQTAGDVSFASDNPNRTMTVDVNSASAITAISVNSWLQNDMNVRVVNSNEAYANTNVALNFGTSFTLSATNAQTQTFTINNLKGNVTATRFDIGVQNNITSNTSTFTVGSKADLVWKGATTIGVSASSPRYAIFNILGKVQLVNGGGKWIVGNGANLNIGSTGIFNSSNQSVEVQTGGTLTSAGTLKMEGGSILNVYGTLNITNTAPSSQFNIYTLNTSGTFTQATDSTGKATGVRIWRTANFNGGANWTVDEHLDLQGNIVEGVAASVTTAKLYLKNNSHLILNEVAGKTATFNMGGLSNAYLTQVNAITDQNSKAVRLSINAGIDAATYNSELHLYSEQTFTDIEFASSLKLYLENDLAKLVLNNDDGKSCTLDGLSASNTLFVYNFADDKIYVGEDAATADAVKFVQAYDADSNLVELTVVNGWLAAVPEPAEWAAIFGAIALGFAVYRRRNGR